MPSNNGSPTTFDPTHPSALALKAALDSKRDQLVQMPPADVRSAANLDASTAAGIVIGSLPRIAKIRGEIAARFGEEGVRFVDDLPTVAYATEQASIELKAADAASDMSAMHAALIEEHALLVTDADSLANRKLVERSRVDAGRPIQGYRATVTSTLVLVSLFREHWSRIEGKTPITIEDLDRVEHKAQEMLRVLNEREQGSTRLPASELRIRALSLLITVYGEVRRMVQFVRYWAEDADDIAPSLWSGRRSRGRNGNEEVDVVDPLVPSPGSPVTPSPVNGGAPFTS